MCLAGKIFRDYVDYWHTVMFFMGMEKKCLREQGAFTEDEILKGTKISVQF